MSHRQSDDSSPSLLSIEDGSGTEVGPASRDSENQVVIATDQQGNSLTLLEEYAARRRQRVTPLQLVLSLACATASLAFAALIYLET